jgi:hypothetical protein
MVAASVTPESHDRRSGLMAYGGGSPQGPYPLSTASHRKETGGAPLPECPPRSYRMDRDPSWLPPRKVYLFMQGERP